MIRIAKDNKNPYTMINNRLLHDKKLSWKAKGILAYLLSLPDDWKVYETEIVNHAADGIGSLRSGIEELIENDYIHRTRERNGKGHLKGYKYSIHETPIKDEASKQEDVKDTKDENLVETKEKVYNYGPKIDKNLAIIAKEYTRCGFGTVGGTTGDLLSELLEEYTVEWIIQSFKICVEANKRTLRYAKGILNRWKTDGGMKLGGKKDGGSNGSDKESGEEFEGEGDKLLKRAIEKYGTAAIPDSEIDF